MVPIIHALATSVPQKDEMPALKHSGDEKRKLGKEKRYLIQRTVWAQAQKSIN